MDPPAPLEVRCNRHFNAMPGAVFDAFVIPREMGRWMFATPIHDMTLLRLDVDPQVGGRFLLQVRHSGQLIEHAGHYLELDRPRRLALAWATKGAADDGSSRTQIDLAPSAGGTELVLTHRHHAKRDTNAGQVREGWNAVLDALGGLFA